MYQTSFPITCHHDYGCFNLENVLKPNAFPSSAKLSQSVQRQHCS